MLGSIFFTLPNDFKVSAALLVRKKLNSVGDIIGDMTELAGQGGFLGIDEIVVTNGPFINPEEDWDSQGRSQFIFLEIGWGGTGNSGGG